MTVRQSEPAAAEARLERSFSLSRSDRRLVLLALDVLLLNAALMIVAARRLDEPFGASLRAHPGWYLLLTAVWLLVAYLMDVYTARPAVSLTQMPAGILTPAAALVIVYLAIPYLTPPLLHSRLTTAVFAGSVIGALVAGRVGSSVILSHRRFRRRVIVVGTGAESRLIIETMVNQEEQEHELVGIVNANGTDPDGPPPAAVLGGLAELPTLVKDRRANEIILALSNSASHPEVFEAVMACREIGVEVHSATDLYERLTGRVPLRRFNSDLRLLLSDGDVRPRMYEGAKRLIDLVIGMCGLALLGITAPFIVPLIVLDGGGVFIRQRRVGQGGRIFTLLKFRTMVPDAEDQGPQWARDGDARVTLVGRVLRRTHLDELPQALNLLRGDMSFVGPRPERPEFVENLARILPYYRARHAVKPGITGWAQVNFPYGASVEDAEAKLEYDLYYIKHASLALDFNIVIRTIGLVLMLRGR